MLKLSIHRKRKAEQTNKLSKPTASLDSYGKTEKHNGDEVKNSYSDVSSVSLAIPCIHQLRQELSCAICLELCYEPCTIACGHSFCKECLLSAADKCIKRCPTCRQLISWGYFNVNTILWNTIQLLFPQQVEEARKTAAFAAPDSYVPQRASRVRNRRHSRSQRVRSLL